MQKTLLVYILFITSTLFGQTSDKYNSVYANFYRGEELFLKEQYGTARKIFSEFSQNFPSPNDPLYIKARYYEGLAALELFQNDAVELLKNFNRNYPESIYKNRILFRLGTYFYQKKNFDEVLFWLNQLRVSDLEPDEVDEFYFKLGYAYFDQNQMNEARSAFFEVKESTSEYGSPALYYFSHIAYQSGAYQTALDGFEKLQNDPKFSTVAPFYIAQIYYLQGKYNEVTKMAPSLRDSGQVMNEKDINLLIGDAFFRVQKYDEALPYLEKFNAKSKTTRAEDYNLGYTYYKTRNFSKAITFFDKTTRVKDTLSHIALYQIGESYLQLDQPGPAREAFSEAADLNFRTDVREDALYQFAVLSYRLDLNPYNEAVVALERYLKEYPNSLRKNDVYQYLVNCYTTTNNYGKALESLDRIPNKDIRLRSAYQVIAFNAGVEQYQKANYDEAIRLFGLVEKFPIEAEISGKAKFWLADANFQKAAYRKAIQDYRIFLAAPGGTENRLKADAYYNMGYAYLQLRDTMEAIEVFKLFTQQMGVINKRKLADAFMRIGDGYYSTRINESAVSAYRSALAQKAGYEDQALFYLARTYGFMSGQTDQKIEVLRELLEKYPSSKYVQMSIQEIADSYKGQQKFSQALKYYEQIISDYPNSLMVKKASIEIADIYYKQNNYTRAETEYRKILNLYNGDRQICEAAGKGLYDLFRTTNQPEKLQAIIAQYPCTNLSADDQEDLFYEPAFKKYNDSNFVAAIPLISKYLEQYPKGKYATEMKVFLGNSFEKTGDVPQAMRIYQEVLQGPNNGYTEFMALKVSRYLYNGGKYAEALPHYFKLEEVSSQPDVIYNARLGIMRSSFLIESWSQAATYAEKILASSQITNTIRLEGEYAKGMSYYHLENFEKSKPALEWISKNTTTIMGAEAKWTLADFYFKRGDYTNSDKELVALMKAKPSYDYWIAKSLMLQSQILIKKEDYVQSEQKLKSVMDHYPITDDGILDKADELWAELMQLKNKPKNLDPVTQPIIEVDGKK